MTTLERSSYSFRRQGSSGHIWDKRHNKPSGGGSATTMAHGIGNSQQHRRIQYDEVSNVATPSVGMETNENPYASVPSSRSESKPPRCSFIAMFGRCARTPAS
ncbi:hypothetical protein RND71_032902 [Anisodus tanguticus]|uniref:Uncharacterized protein n=1 Tax=Anisodus tanguticus TaxID=243964 RepID=A0AAE1R883_9SOLA|nr:hypothetical protein RND71_032902 [Anisodus tanguticus]